MSPTAVIVSPGCAGGGYAGADGAAGGAGCAVAGLPAGGAVAQPASRTSAPPATRCRRLTALLSDADQHRIEIRGAQSRAQPVELGEIADGPDAHAVPHVFVDRDALHVGIDALFLELRRDA